MSAIALLMGLLVLSYLGSLLVGSGKTRGLASGVEYIGLGFAVGPYALGLVERPMITEFEPIVEVALGWLAFGLGLDFGRVDGDGSTPAGRPLGASDAPGLLRSRRVSRQFATIGILCAALTGTIIGAAVWQMLRIVHVPAIGEGGVLVLAAGAGAVGAETTRYGVEWVQTRWASRGPVTRLLVDIGAADDLAPIVAAGAIFAFVPSPGLAFSLPAYGWFGLSLGLGALLGIVTAMLLRGAEGDAVWGALIGTLLLVVGTAARFGLCTIFVTFVMGIALAAASPSRRALRNMVAPTERAILYPMLLLAGARIDPRPLLENRMLMAVVALVLLARIFGKLLTGLLVRLAVPVARPAGPVFGMVLLSSGPVTMSCGFVFALRFPGPIGDTLLVAATASAVLGELVATLALKNLLTESGEIIPAPPVVPPPPSVVKIPSSPPPPLESELLVEKLEDEDLAE